MAETHADVLIVPLSGREAGLHIAGGKGANLQRLMAGGLPVPPGFIVTTAAYSLFVQTNNLAPTIGAQAAATSTTDPESFERASAAIRAAFEAGRIPPPLAQAIGEAYAALGEGSEPAVAVRSSATAEDLPEASFAGQQDTYLNICGQAAVLAAAQRCWSSLWTARAMAYRAKQVIAPEAVALAVVVQALVPAEASGVLFTVNPVTGNRDEMLINATWGLGEALVAGRVNPDLLVVDRVTGRVRQAVVGAKEVLTAAGASGVVEVEMPEERRQKLALTESVAGELAALGARIEAVFGQPQDIEWAVAGERVFILQARAVTAIAGPAAQESAFAPGGTVPGDDAWPPLSAAEPQPFDVWTQADVGERWPEPVSPFTWSTWQIITQGNMEDSLGYIQAPYFKDIQWTRRAFGRVYFNEGAMTHLYVEEFGMPASMIAASMGSQAAPPADDRWRWGRLARRLPKFLQRGMLMNSHVKRFEQRFPQMEAWVDEFMQRDLSGREDRELWDEAHKVWWPRMMEHMALHASVTAVSITNFPLLEGMLQRWLGRKELANTLIVGLTGIVTAEIVPALAGMARRVESLGLRSVVVDHEPAAALLQLRSAPEAAPLLKDLNGFLQRHGHRCPTEAEWRYPRWAESPEMVIELIANYVRSGIEAAATPAQRQQREAATAEVEARLGLVKRALFRSVLGRVQHLVRMRDNGQHYLVKLIFPLRRLFATLAGHWAERGWLGQADDFYFLAHPEIEAVVKAGGPSAAGLDLQALADKRRQAYEHWFSVSAPEVLDRDGKPIETVTATAAGAPGSALEGTAHLTGVAASAGRVTGTARVVANPRDAARLQAGDILVTRATDPGWTPVFSIIGGLVLEVGGLLSHGAIVAREYGLPAVVNVAHATSTIADGQTVTVDGGAGRVELS